MKENKERMEEKCLDGRKIKSHDKRIIEHSLNNLISEIYDLINARIVKKVNIIVQYLGTCTE